jgi:hypothetical protein
MTRDGLRLTLAFVGVLLLAGGVVAVLLVSSTLSAFQGDAPNRQPGIQADLVRAAHEAGDGGKVNLADVVPGQWDTAYVWDGYSADVDHSVFPGVDFGIGAHGQDCVVAFASEGRLVSWVRFNVNEPLVHFEPPADGFRVLRDSAAFEVKRDGDDPAGFLLWPADCLDMAGVSGSASGSSGDRPRGSESRGSGSSRASGCTTPRTSWRCCAGCHRTG